MDWTLEVVIVPVADVDRAIDGVRWYVDGIEPMVEGRVPLDGPTGSDPRQRPLDVSPR